jgi:choline monooxygenase
MDSGIAHDSHLHMSLPASWYHRPEIHERERQGIFRREWIWIGRLDQLADPGDYIATEIAGWRVFVIRDRAGDLRAFHNVCRHRAAILVENGAGRCDVLRCRYHGWVYDTAGRLRQTPHFGESPDFDKADYGLFPVRVETWRGLVFVNLDADAAPLVEGLGDLVKEAAGYPIEEYSFVREEVFDMSCNWKTYTDNFVEGYHVPSIHPSFGAVIDFDRFETVGRNRTVIMQAPQKDGSFYGGVWLWRYPNTTMSFFPEGMNMSRIMPLDSRRTRLVYNFFFRDLSAAAMIGNNDTIARNCGVVREDFGICEVSQGNLEAGLFERGPLSPRHEDGVRHFHELVRRSLEHDRAPVERRDP